MIVSFKDGGAGDIFDGAKTKRAGKACPPALHNIARRKMDAINQAEGIGDLRVPPGNRLEALKGDREGQHSIRVNDQYRICFRWTSAGAEEVEIADYH